MTCLRIVPFYVPFTRVQSRHFRIYCKFVGHKIIIIFSIKYLWPRDKISTKHDFVLCLILFYILFSFFRILLELSSQSDYPNWSGKYNCDRSDFWKIKWDFICVQTKSFQKGQWVFTYIPKIIVWSSNQW